MANYRTLPCWRDRPVTGNVERQIFPISFSPNQIRVQITTLPVGLHATERDKHDSVGAENSWLTSQWVGSKRGVSP